MKIPFVDLYAQYLTIKGQIDNAIADTIKDSAFIRGPQVELFEENFEKFLNLNHCISCANGTDALYIAMQGLGLRKGDEVITTAHSWISTSETITQSSGKVVFCDTNAKTYTIDVNQIEAKITSHTVGIIPVHLYGQPADMEEIKKIADKNGLWIIEDCAQAHSAKQNQRMVGTFGKVATFSFYPGKNLGAYGDAGCIVTNDQKLADWMSLFARHGGKGDHLIEGINSRMDGLQAAILNVKLRYLNQWTEMRRSLAFRYTEKLQNVGDVALPYVADGMEHVYHLFVIRTEKRDALMKYLKSKGIATVINYARALPFCPAYEYLHHKPEDFPNAYSNQSKILSLPIFPEMTQDQQDYVCDSIKEFYQVCDSSD